MVKFYLVILTNDKWNTHGELYGYDSLKELIDSESYKWLEKNKQGKFKVLRANEIEPESIKMVKLAYSIKE